MKQNLYYASRAQAAYAAAEAANDPRDAAAYRAAAHTWEQLAKPVTGTTYSMEPHRLQLAALKRDVAEGMEEPACGYSPAGYDEDRAASRVIAKKPVTIEF